MSVLEYLVWGFVALIGLHVVVRVASAAFFRSKFEIERKHNGTQNHTG